MYEGNVKNNAAWYWGEQIQIFHCQEGEQK